MKYLLDTNTCIGFISGRSIPVVERITATPNKDIGVCSIVKYELYYGSKRSNKPEKSKMQQDEFLSRFESLPFDDRAADICADIRANLRVRGTPIGVYDMMIAAIALANDLIVVTHNTREFSRVDGLRLEDWEV